MAILERHFETVAIQGGGLPEILLPTNCPGCGIGLEQAELRAHNYVCTNCGHHFRLGADVWTTLVADEGSWTERWVDIRSHDLLNWTVPKRYQETVETLLEEGLNEAVRTGTCTLDGKPIWLATFDFGFVGGTLSIVAGERLARGMEQAASSHTPYVLISASGGARMQEGVLALMQLAKVNAAVGRLHDAGVPFFSVLSDPTFGGTAASLALLGDINIAEPGASIGFTGPRVIKQATARVPERRVPACAWPGRHGPAAHRAEAAARPPAGDVHVSVWEIVELARHPQRPYSLDYIRRLAPDFIELHGDRLSADDPALVAGIGTWHGRTTVFLGHQKGRSMKDRVARNWGMMHPEGYRKALRLARHAAKFGFPIVSLIDTPGAYPGAGAEERGIAAAIATAIMEWFRIPVPIVAAVIGEGGSGGALGMGVADRVIMLENSIYSVASPEAAASIVWRDNSRKVEAAEQLQLTSREIVAMGVVEEVVPEPAGSASADYDAAAEALDEALRRHMQPLLEMHPVDLMQQRYDRFRYIDSLIDAEPHFGPKID